MSISESIVFKSYKAFEHIWTDLGSFGQVGF
jgi:hypothetical protein